MQKNKEIIFVTGAAGFIGFHLCKKLLQSKNILIGLDNLNNYYDVNLKKERLKILETKSKLHNNKWSFIRGDLENKVLLSQIFNKFKPNIVVHLGAQVGVRYSLKNPESYINSNIVGFSNILEQCRNHKIKNLIYASSSSVYGGNKKVPFDEKDNVDHPISLYAATKKSNELMAHTYSNLFNIPTTGLRFFTVYGPWGRPDMAPIIFTKSILEKKKIKVFNYGLSDRDFTYIDDVIECIYRLILKPAKANKNFDRLYPESSSSWAPYKIFNVGNNEKINLIRFIEIIENELGTKAIKEFKPLQKGDVESTLSNTNYLEKWIGFKPKTNLKDGIKKMINWYVDYYLK